MNSETERFIELATRTFGGNAELRLSAESELGKSLGANGESRPQAVTEALASLEESSRHSGARARWRVALVAVVVVVSLPLMSHAAWQLRKFSESRMWSGLGGSPTGLLQSPRGLDSQQSLLLLGAGSELGGAERWKPLWDSSPDNPAYLADYARAYFAQHDALSPEILAAAERIDPENVWFPTLAAVGNATKVVTRERTPYTPAKSPPKTPVWIIHDEKRLDETLDAIHRLADGKKFSDYQDELLRQRIPLLPPRRDFVTQFTPMVYLNSVPTASVALRRVSDVMGAGAQRAAAKGDIEGFRRIADDWKALVPMLARNGDTMIDVMIARAFFAGPSLNLRDGAKTLGLEEEARYFTRVCDLWLENKTARETRGKPDPDAVLLVQRGSIFASLSFPMLRRQVSNPPRITPDDLRPARYADQAIMERGGAILGFLLLGFSALAAFVFRFRHGPMIGGLAPELVGLLRRSDWFWIAAGGISLPLLWYFVIVRLTPLSGREWSARLWMFIQQGGQFGCMVLSMIVMTVQVASWRLAKRGAVIGLEGRFSWVGWMAAVALFLAVPAFGALVYVGEMPGPLLAAAGGIWIFAGIGLCLFGGDYLRRAVLARIVGLVWVFGMLVMAALVPFFYLEERRWIQQDRLGEISSDAPGPSRYEYEVTQVLRAEVLELFARAGANPAE